MSYYNLSLIMTTGTVSEAYFDESADDVDRLIELFVKAVLSMCLFEETEMDVIPYIDTRFLVFEDMAGEDFCADRLDDPEFQGFVAERIEEWRTEMARDKTPVGELLAQMTKHTAEMLNNELFDTVGEFDSDEHFLAACAAHAELWGGPPANSWQGAAAIRENVNEGCLEDYAEEVLCSLAGDAYERIRKYLNVDEMVDDLESEGYFAVEVSRTRWIYNPA
jgi:hypothetical protein